MIAALIQERAAGGPIGVVGDGGVVEDFELLAGGSLLFGFRVVIAWEESDHTWLESTVRLVDFDGVAFPLLHVVGNFEAFAFWRPQPDNDVGHAFVRPDFPD